MRARRKLKNKSGFSLAETLLAVLILLLVSTIVANGIPVAKNVYNKVIVGSNAQLLLSTTVTALRNELGTSQRIKVSTDKKSVIYYKQNKDGVNAFSRIDLMYSENDKSIQVTDYIDQETGAILQSSIEDAVENKPRKLITSATANGNLYVTYDTIEYDETKPDLITFKGIQVKSTVDDAVIAQLESPLNIRIISLTAEAA